MRKEYFASTPNIFVKFLPGLFSRWSKNNRRHDQNEVDTDPEWEECRQLYGDRNTDRIY